MSAVTVDRSRVTTRFEALQALGFSSEDEYNQHQNTMRRSKEMVATQLAAVYEVYTGRVEVEGNVVRVDFQAPLNATQAEKDSAFLTALAQVATLDYLCIGSFCEG